MSKQDWLALGDAFGPQPAPYHPEPYRFPRPVEPVRGELEYPGAVVRLADLFGRLTIAGDPHWRQRRYVRGEDGE